MDITIKDPAAAESIIENYKLQWTLRLAKVKAKLLLYYVCSGVGLVMGIVGILRAENHSHSRALFNFDMNAFILAFALMLGLVALQYQLMLNKQHKLNLAFLKGLAELMLKNNNESTMRLTDETVFIDFHKNSEEVGWEYFNQYSVYKNLLILHRNKSVIENIIVDKDLISEAEFNEIFAFVSEKLERFNY